MNSAVEHLVLQLGDPRVQTAVDAFNAEMEVRYTGYDDGSTDAARERAFAWKPEDIVHASVLQIGGETVAAGMLGSHDGLIEIRKVWVSPDHRGKGLARLLLRHLEDAVVALGADRVVLMTGALQPDAKKLYETSGYTEIDPFPPYDDLAAPLSYEKRLLGAPRA